MQYRVKSDRIWKTKTNAIRIEQVSDCQATELNLHAYMFIVADDVRKLKKVIMCFEIIVIFVLTRPFGFIIL